MIEKLRQDSSQSFFGRIFSVLNTIFIKPKSSTEDEARREFILNVFLLPVIVLLSSALFMVFYKAHVMGRGYRGDSPYYIAFLLCLFVCLFILSRTGRHNLAAHLFIAAFFFALIRGVSLYGIDEPQSLLGLAILIVVAGILIGSRVMFAVTILSAAAIMLLGHAQINNAYRIRNYWKREEDVTVEEPIMFSISIGIIAAASWLSTREIEKSLKRARRSEGELKQERDSLEITLQKRTAQLERFAEFGQNAAGLFHDLVNPLTAVSLNMDKALSSARKMEDMVASMRTQLSGEEQNKVFSLNEEIKKVIADFGDRPDIAIDFSPKQEITLSGHAGKFGQIILNLIKNAAESGASRITVSLQKKAESIMVTVADNGRGIAAENLHKIFEPLFSTKGSGFGIGLSTVKRIVEKDFGGSISVTSAPGKGSEFRVIISA